MAKRKPQTFDHHTRIVPLFHVGVFGILVLNLLFGLYRTYRAPGLESGMSALLALALLGLFFYARVFALTVQNRVIRLEMRLRLKALLPADLHPQIAELTTRQLIALRFAADEELPALTRAVLTENIHDQGVIKKRIKNWQADYLRA
ncbi:MAG TPA: DUF6526 family protein [Vicinamibacteria bacterium]|nr:DUF6526 family protein [Vicinamibacteria bacterium]